MELTVTKAGICSLTLVADKIYADFNKRDSYVNEKQMDDMFEQVCTV